MATQAEIQAYLDEVDDVLKELVSGGITDMAEIRVMFTNLLDDVKLLVSRMDDLTQNTIITVLRSVADKIDALAVKYGIVFDHGLGAADELSRAMMTIFGTKFVDGFITVPGAQLSPEILRASRAVSASLVTGIGTDIRRAIERALRLGALGVGGDRNAVVAEINRLLGKPGFWSSRAEAIYRTETQRFFSIVTQGRMEQMNTIVEMNKQWIWSKISRKEHAAIDGQVVPVKGTFKVPLREGGTIRMRYPRDERAWQHPSAVLNCGCFVVPSPA